MGRQVSLFSGYSQKENRTTNYCLLVLKMLYEENPKFLAEAMEDLVGPDLGGRIGVKFLQQEKKTASVPDGLIYQPGFTIYIETKNFDWFHDGQLSEHLAALDAESPGLKILIALSAFDSDSTGRFRAIRQLCESKYKKTIAFAQISFQEFLDAVAMDHLPKNLDDTLAEFRTYLDEERLLPNWHNLLDVVNCAGLPDDVLVENVYMCPAAGGAYNHAKCKYFGMYRWKRVEKIALIEAVADVEDAEKATLKWRISPGHDDYFVQKAREKVAAAMATRTRQYPIRVFLLGQLHDTDFRKDTSGGMMGSKQYFDVGPLKVEDAGQLAQKLNGVTWSQVKASQ